WVVFEDIFLAASCLRGVREMREIAARTADLRRERDRFEIAVGERTKDLAASGERFRSLSISSPVGIFETDAEGLCTYVNPRWVEISGMDAERSLGHGWADAIHASDRDDVLRRWDEAARANREWSMEFRLETPSHGVRWVHSRARPVLSPAGRVTGHVGSVEDITDGKRAESRRKS